MSDAEANPRHQEGEQPGQGEQSAAAVAAPAKRSQPREPKPLDLFHVVLHDDDEHTYEYVIKMMQQLFACDIETAFERAKIVDAEGRVICATVHKELAELKRDQIHAFGPDRRIASCKGAMSASVEPAA
jgi:ATP-dependent Clp protease adaptor protein ClpS